ARNRAERHDELVPLDGLRAAVERLVRERARARVRTRHAAEPDVGAPKLLAQRYDDVARLERPGRGAGQERRVEQEVRVGDERDVRALCGQDALELACRV